MPANFIVNIAARLKNDHTEKFSDFQRRRTSKSWKQNRNNANKIFCPS